MPLLPRFQNCMTHPTDVVHAFLKFLRPNFDLNFASKNRRQESIR